MLELNNVNKFFNKHKKNELHVINNVSLKFSNKGLVALLGPSGSGKTTMLNVIGGLDRVKSGKIFIDGKKLNSKLNSRVDKIRNLSVGYIFQDYKLIENKTVFDNVALSLNIIGIKNKKDIKERVEYILDKVGMLRYKKRPASMLSGGERQRVGIARALVKDPDIILADEPTGNLDSKNSLEIMNIISAIAKEKLVILVTHEQNLAKFYATRIIEFKDGCVVKDYKNDHPDDLDYAIENKFYLKDFKKQNNLKNDNCNINVYSNDNEDISIDIVVKNGNYFIKTNTINKIEVVDDNSSVEFINEKYKKINKNDVDKYVFKTKEIKKKKYSSIFNPITLITNGFKKVFDYSFLKKLLLLGFLLSGGFIMYGVSTINAVFTVKDESFVKYNKNYVVVQTGKNKVSNYMNYENVENIKYILPGDSKVKFNMYLKDLYQSSRIYQQFEGSLTDISLITEADLMYGRMPQNEYEIVVDKLVFDRASKSSNYLKMTNITNVKQLLNKDWKANYLKDFKVVGITNTNSPSVYALKNIMINLIGCSANEEGEASDAILDVNTFKDNIVLKSGLLPNNDYEVIVNINHKGEMKLNKEIDKKVNGKKLKVVGFYFSSDNYDYYLTNTNTYKYLLITNTENIMVLGDNKNNVIKAFNQLELNAKDSYLNSKEEYKSSMKEKNDNNLLVSGIILGISLIEIFLMSRSSFLSRVKEVGIYRAIGVKKKDIYKMFIGEILAITTLASVSGIILATYILSNLSKIKYLNNMFIVNPFIIGISIIIVYLFNIIIGLLPVFNTMRKKPAQILARHDID